MGMRKRLVGATAAVIAAVVGLTACSGGGGGAGNEKKEASGTIEVAAIETAYGQDGWKAVTKAFTDETGIKVDLVMDKKLEDVIGPKMKANDYPDVIHLAQGREAGLTETFIKDKGIADITDVFSSKIPGEDVTVKSKLVEGFTGNTLTDPYGGGKTYLAPMFYTPTGLYYDANLLKENGWEAPKTWDEMWALGDKAKAKGIYLFTYPTAGYFDAFFYGLLYTVGGQEFFDKATHFEEGVWDTPEAQQVFDIIAKIAKYTNPVTPSQANSENFTANQQLVLDHKAIFMPNGDWVVGEMADAPRAKGFEWANIPLPTLKAGDQQYAYTFFEQAWIPAKAKNQDAAKKFIAFLYSDKATEAFAKVGAMQPTKNVQNYMDESKKAVYGVYENGAKAAMGNMASFKQIEGLDWKAVWFEPINSLVSGDMTKEQWVKGIKEASDKIRPNVQS
ncbi:carbohydrate ABC transporter substrate-binding protein [Cutibacterium sp.]|uniref:carbohydrate ABC transporter substrate-binding protein n=1 Tax=Cutibacterium sp. TaxID=1912221 RepID=UPI0026DD9CF9|nr:carbohydrate ABC transporter substrate-binding protein [Cutibacterium sp.]MDO4412596.1 carbohydrate ABC transporter substrate-binding protein [Cutibacterium sp.]